MFHHTKGDPCRVGCGATARLFSESHRAFLSSFSLELQMSPQDPVPPQPPHFPSTAGPPGSGNQQRPAPPHPIYNVWDFIHEESSTFISCPLSPMQGPPFLLLQILQTKPLQPVLLTFSPKAMTDRSSSHQVIPSSTGTSNIFSLAPQHPKHQANEWEGTGEVLQAQIITQLMHLAWKLV